jgi:hypothetical protein
MQAANRVNFNQPEEEFLDGDEVVGLGVLGKEGSGRLRMQARAWGAFSFFPKAYIAWLCNSSTMRLVWVAWLQKA